jgi:DeoR family transcriptional regulator, fructose operon transcriptional repressor
MALTKRQRQILESIRELKKATVTALSRQFEVSEASIRLDLTDLEDEGLVHRFHGGARIVPASSWESRIQANFPAKTAIAQRAAGHIQEGETIFLDSGTTILLLSKELGAVEGLTIVTNAPPLLAHLGAEPGKKIMLIGGEYRHDSQCTVGPVTEKELEDVYVSKVFMGADSVDVDSGVILGDLRNLGYIQKVIKNAKETILLSDSSKFNRIRGMKIGDLSQVQVIITDARLPDIQRDKIRRMGISLEIVEEDGT